VNQHHEAEQRAKEDVVGDVVEAMIERTDVEGIATRGARG
jgi:hypothetical protein